MVNVIGLGYIGLPTALMMASHGVEVIGTDYNTELVKTLNNGKTTFKEDGLEDLFHDAVDAGIIFSTEYQVADTYIISVPTPYDKKFKTVDASYVVKGVESVLEVALENATIVIESTITSGVTNPPSIASATRNGLRVEPAGRGLMAVFTCPSSCPK